MLPNTTMMIVNAIYSFLSWSYTIWIYASIIILVHKTMGKKPPPIMNLMWYWLKTPTLVYVILYMPLEWLTSGELKWWNLLFGALNAWNYRNFKDIGDDDDHKKLKKKISDKIKAVAGKLVITPEPA